MTEILAIKQLQGNQHEICKILDQLHGASVTARSVHRLQELIDTLRDDLIVTIEYDYVDATYRDEYYRFYATKFRGYARNCAKMSFFLPGVLTPGAPVDYSRSEEIIQSYLGFVVLRPIDACIGRNVISVKAKKPGLNDISICQTNVNTTAIGLKVSVKGFPHSSQDGEMMACAETALWSIAEYYGHKYPGHKPVSPSEILEAMRPFSYQRQLPSKGLTFDQISVGMRTFGFSPEVYRLYTKDPADPRMPVISPEMKEVLACYIESGFPLAICLQGGGIGHAVVCIGKADGYEPFHPMVINGKRICFSNQSIENIVFNDDNATCYQKTSISAPTAYYNQKKWDKVLLTSFIVPLPSKVYMDAFVAIHQFRILLGYVAPDNTIARTYLASCRSLRNHIATSRLMSNEDKAIILNIELPRFVWVTECGSADEYSNGMSSGLFILDATEPAELSTNALIIGIIGKNGFGYNPASSGYDNLTLPTPFRMERYNKNIY